MELENKITRSRTHIEKSESDTRNFSSSNFENKAKTRKEMRKQKRVDKKVKKMPVPKAMRPDHRFTAPKSGNAQPAKQTSDKVSNKPAPKRAMEEQKEEREKPAKKRKENKQNSLQKLSTSNPLFYSLIESDNLISSSSRGTDISDKAVEQDDLAIAMYEKKLGLDKKKKKAKEGAFKLGTAFEEDGLMDILDGLDDEHYESARKGAGISVSKKSAKVESDDSDEESDNYSDDSDGDVNGYLDELEGGYDSESMSEGEEDEDEDEDQDEDEDEDNFDEDEDEDQDQDDEDSEMEDVGNESDRFQSDDEYLELPEGDEETNPSDLEDGKVEPSMNSAATVKDHIKIIRDGKQGADDTETNGRTATAGKYVPPHLRGTATTKSEQQIRLQRALQGLLNKLSESNLESILLEIEKCYSNYPRHGKKHAYTIFLYVFALGLMSSFFLTDVTSSLTELILTSISQKSNLLDSFVILYAVVVGSLYRLIGIDFGKLLKYGNCSLRQIF